MFISGIRMCIYFQSKHEPNSKGFFENTEYFDRVKRASSRSSRSEILLKSDRNAADPYKAGPKM